MGKNLVYGSAILLLAFCTPPEHYQRRHANRPTGQHTGNFIFEKGFFNDNTNDDFFQPGSEIIRVKLYEGSPLPVETRRYRFRSKNGTETGSGNFIPTASGVLSVSGKLFRFKGKNYPGELEIAVRKGHFTYINLVSLDDYLVSVAGHEMSPNWPLESLKAQVVVARTYLFQKIKEANGRLWHVDGTTNHQVYGGLVQNEQNLREAVTTTRGQVINFSGQLAQVFFHSSCGGHTASAREVWGSDFAYLPAQHSRYCEPAPVYRWKESVSLAEIGSRLGLGKIRSLQVKDRSPSKRVKTLQASTASGIKIIRADDFRMKLGASRIKSTFFGLKQQGGNLIVSGRGYGHGVGMCQWGAKFMAEKHNLSYRQIIRHYFPGTSIGNVSLDSLS